jgi:hypothetical protein
MNGETNTASRKHLRAKIQIGNSKGAITYHPAQNVFHPDDIKSETRERVKEVKEWAKHKPETLANEWNISTHTNAPLYESRKMENHVRDRNTIIYNYRSEVMVPKAAPPIPEKTSKFTVTLSNTDGNSLNPALVTLKRTEEYTVNPKLNDATKWNGSTKVTDNDLGQSFARLNENANKNSKAKNDKLATKNHHVSPMERSVQLQEEVRNQKRSGTFSLTKQVFAEPEKPVDRKSLTNRCAIEISLKHKTTTHTGKWEFNKAEGRHMWSDTGSFDYDSPGDLVKVHNPDRYIYDRPTLAK